MFTKIIIINKSWIKRKRIWPILKVQLVLYDIMHNLQQGKGHQGKEKGSGLSYLLKYKGYRDTRKVLAEQIDVVTVPGTLQLILFAFELLLVLIR